jgi:transcriptional regulator with XRE-family HTH domain
MSFMAGYIRGRREKLGMTINMLAMASGETASFISDVEHGRKMPTIPMLTVLALEIPKPKAEETIEKGKTMNARDFVYWLQGFFEMADPKQLSEKQVELIKGHLAMVFIHEIDPEANAKTVGTKEALDVAHSGEKFPGELGSVGPDGLVMRC